MKAKGIWVILLAGLLFCLSGCMFRGTDELFDIPRTSESNQKLQAKVQSIIGNATGISPVSGSNTQTLQLVDLDRDGTQEALAFYRDSSTEWPLKIAILKQDEQGNYALFAQIEGAGTDIESIEYKNLVEGPEQEIIVSWQVTPTVHTLVAYSVRQNQVAELMRSGYTRYVATDLNGDERAELLLIQLESSDPVGNRVELYTGVGGAMEFHSSAPLSDGLIALQLWETGFLAEKIPSLMVTSEYAGNKYITDIFYLSETGLRNLTLDENTRISSRTLRQHTGVSPIDINKDGITEIPITRSIPTYNGTGSENFWQITWMQFATNGTQKAVLSTYHNNSDRWYLELPEAWIGQITLSRQEQTSSGERAVVFSYWKGNPQVPPVPFLTIYRLTGNNRDNNAAQNQRFTLWADSDTIYAAEFLDSSWNCGIDQTKLIELFHTI